MHHYLIIANGTFLAKAILLEASANKTIVALDGAITRLRAMEIKPDIIVGDFDSLSPDDAEYWGIGETFQQLDDNAIAYHGHHGTLIVPTKDQNHTDLVKAIRYCDSQQAASITLICALGGRVDHHENAMRVLRSEHKKERPLLIHTEQHTLRYAKDEKITVEGRVGDTCGIMAFPKGKFTSHGLEYDVKDFELEFGFSESISNALRTSPATLEISGEALIMLPPQLAAQRHNN
jgi:thiamine pyrophosphokinase